jgi:DNA-binding transcriptional ArsR family regulator
MSTDVRLGDVDLAAVARLFAEPARASMLGVLADGRSLPATQLAAEAGVAPSTASEHLARLLEAGMVSVERTGRHRYYRLAGAEVAAVVEAMSRIAPPRRIRNLRDGIRSEAVRAARMCYDHLGGRLAVDLHDALVTRGMVVAREGLLSGETGYELAPAGRRQLEELGVTVPDSGSRRPLVRHCVDWSERRHHLAGGLGAALATWVLDCGWAVRATAGRAVVVTDEGRHALRERLGLVA